MSAWAVSTGSYSDYVVECICPTKEVAEAVALRMNGLNSYGNAEVEEFLEVDDPERVRFLLSYNVSITKYHGRAVREMAHTGVHWALDKEPDRFYEKPSVYANDHGPDRPGFSVSVTAYDEGLAWKIAREKAAEMMAKLEGL